VVLAVDGAVVVAEADDALAGPAVEGVLIAVEMLD
jgi:hypothetical protein